MSGNVTNLILDVRTGEVLKISGNDVVHIELKKKSGQLARLRITAPADCKIEKCSRPDDASMAE